MVTPQKGYSVYKNGMSRGSIKIKTMDPLLSGRKSLKSAQKSHHSGKGLQKTVSFESYDDNNPQKRGQRKAGLQKRQLHNRRNSQYHQTPKSRGKRLSEEEYEIEDYQTEPPNRKHSRDSLSSRVYQKELQTSQKGEEASEPIQKQQKSKRKSSRLTTEEYFSKDLTFSPMINKRSQVLDAGRNHRNQDRIELLQIRVEYKLN